MIKATYIDHMGSDLSVVNAARVSFGKKSHCEEVKWLDMGSWCGDQPVVDARDAKLISYLANHEHLSPFGHCFASFHINAPIFVARQLVKHKFLRWNEISRRYVDDPPEFYKPDHWRGRSADKKQGSDGVIPLEYIDTFSGKHIRDYFHECGSEEPYEHGRYLPEQSVADDVHFFHEEDVLDLYNRLLHEGVAPEQARMVLPQSTMTEWYWSGSLDAFASMCNLRLKPDTQYESRIVAQQISDVMKQLFPVSWASLVVEGG